MNRTTHGYTPKTLALVALISDATAELADTLREAGGGRDVLGLLDMATLIVGHLAVVDPETGSDVQVDDALPPRPDVDVDAALAAPDLLEALKDECVGQAHDALSELLEDPDCGNDRVREAAIELCSRLCDFDAIRRAALSKAGAA